MTPEIWTEIISALVTLALAILVPLLGVGTQVLLKKLKLEQNQAVQQTVRSAIAFAEEKGAQVLKAQAGALLPPQKIDKLNVAVERIMMKVPGVTQAEAEALVHEELPKVALGAAATFRGLADAAKQ